jgi:aminoglycoside/choline kinase family phosphotransferase
VRDRSLESIERLIAAAVASRWPGARAGAITAIKGDASGRRFWRVTIESLMRDIPESAVAVDLGPHDLPLYARALGLLREPLDEPPLLNVHRFLESIGAAVPELYAESRDERMILMEDLGCTPLFEAALNASGEAAAALYRAAIDQLLLIHCEGSRCADGRCIAFGVAYDERLFRWELEQFIEFGMPAIAPASDAERLRGELDDLAARLGAVPRVFSHRDYHGHNLFVHRGEIRVIDFQDALMAPAAQDLAVLMTTRDTSRIVAPALEERLLNYYLAGRARRDYPETSAAAFFETYWLCVLQHSIKAIGRFVYLERGGMRGYAVYLPFAAEQARRALDALEGFPALRDVFRGAAQ